MARELKKTLFELNWSAWNNLRKFGKQAGGI